MNKPTPDELARLRAAYPQGAPRIDYREMKLVVDRAAPAPEAQGDGGGDDENAPIPIAISSEAPVLRYDWWADELYYEVLDHSGGAVDLSYSRDGLPFIMSHRAYDGDSQHGLVENVRVEKGVLRGDVRFSRSARAQEIRADVVDGIRTKVSVGYIVSDNYDQTAGKGADAIPTRRYKDWMPIEASMVPVPADYEVGVGRLASASGQAALARFLELHPAAQRSQDTPSPSKGQEGNMADNANAPAGGATVDVKVVRDEGVQVERTRVKNISELASTHKIEQDRVAQWLSDGKSESEVSREINTILAARINAGQHVSPNGGAIELNAKEHKRFSFARALLVGMESREVGNIDLGFEKEIMDEARKRTPVSVGKGVLIPFVTQKGERANVDSATSTTGGAFKFTQPGDFIELIRKRTSVMRAGATVLTGLQGPVTFPKQNAAATGSWVAENPGSDMSRSNLTTTTVSLAFKTIQAATAVSRQALFSAAAGNYDLEAIIRNDLAKVIALAIDLGALNGLGSSNQPLGVLQDTNVGTATALGAAGGTMAWSNWVDLETAVASADADIGTMAYITNAKQRAVGKKTAVLAATSSGVPIWGGIYGGASLMDAQSAITPNDGIVNGYRAISSNQVPSNLTKGTSTTICSAVVFGVWEHLLVGQFGAGFEVLVDPYTLKLQNMVDLTAWNFVDVANRYPTAFATIKDAL